MRSRINPLLKCKIINVKKEGWWVKVRKPLICVKRNPGRRNRLQNNYHCFCDAEVHSISETTSLAQKVNPGLWASRIMGPGFTANSNSPLCFGSLCFFNVTMRRCLKAVY